MEDGIEQKPSTPEEKEQHVSQLSSPLPNILMFLGVIVMTLSIITAGYFKGNMHIETVWHNLHNFA
ncbi:hypothetical protein KNU05_gp040 [Synechococcus virus S-PRM1]|uniref:Uncharacterized protein n=1 Tax=Synechococcus virus S-PRM1 TaxID=2100130 RepID=A0A346FKK9_9CAUD|nr:hypothetical protein KNU05_gp040 [Synechococcus virus S-PRM1]AXN58514.1 hypothetical protein [Synechococcus virus S-PRM1]